MSDQQAKAFAQAKRNILEGALSIFENEAAETLQMKQIILKAEIMRLRKALNAAADELEEIDQPIRAGHFRSRVLPNEWGS